MSLDILTRQFLSCKGKGKVSFNDGVDRKVDFSINLTHNGRIQGSLEFPSDDPILISYQLQTKKFNFTGVDDDYKKTILAEDCMLVSYEGRTCRFSTHRIKWDPCEIRRTTTKELSIRFSLVNVYETLGVYVQTNLGVIKIHQYESYKEMEKLMRNYNIPLITSVASLYIKDTKNKKIEDILKEAIETIRDFLKVTSLAQTCWHDWTLLEVYEQIEATEQGKVVYREMRSPKLKPPHYRQLTMPVHSCEFINAAWKGYSHELDKFGFDYALEWYIESNSVQLDVIRFVLASTCLELLISKFYNLKLYQNTMQDEQVRLLYSSIRKHLSKYLRENKIENDTISQICNLITIKKAGYVDKTRQLLEYWGISVDDIETKIEEIVKIRDSIIHRGMYFHDENISEAMKVIKASEDLFHILSRLFLAMLKYNDQYYYPPNNRWIKFSDVCSKIAS